MKIDNLKKLLKEFENDIIFNADLKKKNWFNIGGKAKFLKANMYGKKIVVGMGAGSISNWMKELPKLM